MERHRLAILHPPRLRTPLDQLYRQPGEAFDLPPPLVLQGGGTDHQYPLHPGVGAQPDSRGDRLQGLAKPHVIGQQGATGSGQKRDPLHLVGVEPRLDPRDATAARLDPLPNPGRPQVARLSLGEATGVTDRILAEVNNTLATYEPDELRKNPATRQTAALEANKIMEDMAGFMNAFGGQ
jgi:hypothetical protein